MAPSWGTWLRIVAEDSLYAVFLNIYMGIYSVKQCLSTAKPVGWDASHIPSLDGKVAVVTGGNAGIGLYVATQLALKGARVYLAARSESRANAAISQLLDENPSVRPENVAWLQLDLSSQAAVVQAAAALRAKEERLDILVNNAGVSPYEYVQTSDGFEMTAGVNHVGHWTLTYSLLPLLKKTSEEPDSDVRIITLSSSGHSQASPLIAFITPADLSSACAPPGREASCLAQFRRYGTSKLANILFAAELQRRLDEDSDRTGILSLAVNPGPVRTEGAADVLPWIVRPWVPLVFAPVEKGALGTLWAAAAPEVRMQADAWKGALVNAPGVGGKLSERARDEGLARRLWITTHAAVKGLGVLAE